LETRAQARARYFKACRGNPEIAIGRAAPGGESKITAGSCFEALDASEIKRLVQAFELARGKFLGHCIQSVLQFTLQSWSQGDFAGVHAMSEMNDKGRFVPLFEYAAAPPGNTDSLNCSEDGGNTSIHSF